MHTYTRPDATCEPGDLSEVAFRSADDLAAFAATDPTIGRKTWPEVWHLDADGHFACYFRAFTRSSLLAWADDPYQLWRSREEGLAWGGCTDDWLIVDSRPTSICGAIGRSVVPTEGDVLAYRRVEEHLAEMGVRLLDAVVFDDEGHWWSMRELTTGSTQW